MLKIDFKTKFDKEYSTQWSLEQRHLSENGIPYSFVKTDSNGITTWKYTKTFELFSVLAKFYENIYYKK